MNRICYLVILLLAGSATMSLALPSYNLQITNQSFSNDFPGLTLSNTSTGGEQLTEFNLTIGLLSKHIDFVSFQSNNIGGVLSHTPSTTSNVNRSDFINMKFTGFDSGEFITFRADFDVDPNINEPNQDFRSILFNNGSSDNAVLTVSFSNGEVLSQVLPDGPTNNTYNFSQTSAVPEPGSWLLGLLAVIAVVGFRSRR